MKKMVLCAAMVITAVAASLLAAVRVSGAVHGFRIETSPDGKMWTVVQEIPEDERYIEEGSGEERAPSYWYDAESSILTFNTSAVRELNTGEHYYQYARTGTVPVGEWKVKLSSAYCTNGWVFMGSVGHGITFGNQGNCGRSYYSGWMAYCADCGEPIMPGNVHMSYEAAKTIDAVNVDMGYYYICPCSKPVYRQIEYEDAYDADGNLIKRPVEYEITGYIPCGHLEKYWEPTPHTCKSVSYNRYRVVYDPNASGVSGEMEPSFHMYNNEEYFEGKKVTPITTLSLCTYDRTAEGYMFVGWNTRQDGSGIAYSDGAPIYNLSLENYDEGTASVGTVTLYAQWKKVQSTLIIDAAGGSYSGVNPITRTWNYHGVLNSSKLTPPAGYTVSFQANGGSLDTVSITGTRSFYGWELQSPANGRLLGDNYIFSGPNNSVDTVRAIYRADPITLPTPTRANYSFGGWYLDRSCTRLAGYGGDPYIPAGNITMYAKWVDLKLTATPDYTVNSGKGAADLTWGQQDGTRKTYKIYRKAEGEADFAQVYLASDEGSISTLNQTYGYEGRTRTVTIQSSGFYTLTAEGAQGGSYGIHTGGLGGSVSGTFYLSKGEVISFTVGGQNGYNSGGAATDYGNGGGCTIVSSDQKGILLVAGGGGGATGARDGLPGGSEAGYLVESGNAGQNGMAGGGGGYLGGIAGTRIIHTHSVEAGCYRDASCNVLTSAYAANTENRQWKDRVREDDGTILRDHVYFSQQVGDTDKLIPVNGNTTLDIGAWVRADGHNYIDGSSYVEVRNQDDIPIFTATIEQLREQWARQPGNYVSFEDNRIFSTWDSLPVAYIQINDNWEQSENSGGSYDLLVGHHVSYTLYYEDGTCQLAKVKLDGNYKNPGYSGNYSDEYYPDYEFIHTGLSYRGYDDRPVLFSRRSFWYGTSGAHFRYMIDIPEGTTGIYLYAEGMINTMQHGEVRPSADYTVYFDQIQLSGSLVLECREADINTPAYGGSSYVNPDFAFSRTKQEGVRAGNGGATIRAELTGLVEATGLDNVEAPDIAAPDEVNHITREEAGDNVAAIRFEQVQDNGTRYYFKAESYSTETGGMVCESNIAECLITSGVKGYYYLVDENSQTRVRSGNFLSAAEERYITVEIEETVQYLHIAAVDMAGNVSATVHVEIDGRKIPVAWEITTDTVQISSTVGDWDYGNVYPASDRTYYVRADGRTPFRLSFQSNMHGRPREDYQIDYQIFDSRTTDSSQRQGVILPHTALSIPEAALNVSVFQQWTEGSIILSDASYTGASRSRGPGSEEIDYYRAFTLDSARHGKTVTVTPVAGASFGDTVQYSDWEKDVANAIRLIGDGEAPVIDGLEVLADMALIDREEGTVTIVISAADDLSGVSDFWVEIKNTDNFVVKRYTPDADGIIRIDITEEESVFSGDFTVTAHATDNVGNENTISYSVTECALITDVYRMLAPHEPFFKRGESGVLTIETWGYVEKVEVEFPDFLSRYNQTYVYTNGPQYKEDETIQFMIPLDAPSDGSYEITVKAYKDDKILEDTPVITVSGTVLDELRTRLR